MGSSGSKIKKIFSGSNSEADGGSDFDSEQRYSYEKSRTAGFPMVISRRGSMYFDEDGHLAHEFYEEVLPAKKGAKAKMKRILTNLVPEGDVPYQVPRLSVDYPVILRNV